MDSQANKSTPFRKLEDILHKIGLRLEIRHMRDVQFHNKTVSFEVDGWWNDNEEKLAHEIAHYLVAPPLRRDLKNYGHELPNNEFSYRARQSEENAAAVLGIALQKMVSSRISLAHAQYLWNAEPETFRDSGFWLGAERLISDGWLTDEFNINKEKLETFYR